jgi:hypothetical protein
VAEAPDLFEGTRLLATEEMVTNVTFSASHEASRRRLSHAWHASATALLLAALPCAGASAAQKETGAVQPPASESVAHLPYARGKTFRTLDEYLAHLEAQGALDLPWWREIRPGVYERMTSMPEARREVATRAELMRRFGFTR